MFNDTLTSKVRAGVGKFCVLELRVWLLSAVSELHFCYFQGVSIYGNLVPKCLSFEG